MAKLGKRARKFASKHLQCAAKRNRKLRSQSKFTRRPRKGGNGGAGDGDEEMPQRANDYSAM